MVRYFSHFIIVNSHNNVDTLHSFFSSHPDFLAKKLKFEDRKLVDLLIESILFFLIENPVYEKNFSIHFELINLLEVFYSTSYYGGSVKENSQEHNIFLESTVSLRNSHIVCRFVHGSLTSIVSSRLKKEKPEWETSMIRNTLSMIGSIIGTTIYLPIFALRAVFTAKESDVKDLPDVFANRSMSVFLLILFYRKNKGKNPFLDVIASLKSSSKDRSELSFKFNDIQEVFERNYDDELSTLLLYTLIHENVLFRAHMVQLDNPAAFIVPILWKLYSSGDEPRNHLYLILTLLTILSGDSDFCSKLDLCIIGNATWYSERILGDISLSSLLCVILTRVVIHDINHQKDAFLANNCLAILLNLAPFIKGIHPHAAQKLFYLLSVVQRKYNKSINLEEKDNFGKLIQMIVETINCLCTYQIQRNPWIVYEVLHQKETLQSRKIAHLIEKFSPNFEEILDYFEPKCLVKDNVFLTVENILESIIKGLVGWKSEKLALFEHFKFNYAEDSNTETFIYPYIWNNAISRNHDLKIKE